MNDANKIINALDTFTMKYSDINFWAILNQPFNININEFEYVSKIESQNDKFMLHFKLVPKYNNDNNNNSNVGNKKRTKMTCEYLFSNKKAIQKLSDLHEYMSSYLNFSTDHHEKYSVVANAATWLDGIDSSENHSLDGKFDALRMVVTNYASEFVSNASEMQWFLAFWPKNTDLDSVLELLQLRQFYDTNSSTKC